MKCPITIFNYSIVKNEAQKSADIFIDGDIVDASTQDILKDWFSDETSVSYKSFRNELLNLGYTDVNVYVNSYGGHVGDAMAMHDTIQDLNNKGWNINTYGRGMVCSSATYLVMAGKNGGEVSKNTSWLIHNVSGGIWGNVNDVENYAKTMRKFNNMIVDFYAEKTGMSKAVVSDLMDKETWFTGKEISDKGFVASCTGYAPLKNEIEEKHWPYSNMAVLNKYNSSITNSNTDKMDFEKFKNDLMASIKGLLKSNMKPEEMENVVANAITNGFKKFDETREADIANAVQAALGGETLTNAVQAAVNKALENVPESVTNAITDATKGFVNEEKFENLLNEVADKIGKPGGEKNKLAPEDKNPYNHEGVSIEV